MTGFDSLSRYKSVILLLLVLIGVFVLSPELATSAGCTLPSNCAETEYCCFSTEPDGCPDLVNGYPGGVGYLRCALLSCAVYNPISQCSYATDCGSGQTCYNQIDDVPKDHTCGWLRSYGTCQSCTSGYADCDSCPAGQVTCAPGGVKGCETDITTAQNCGSCGRVCDPGQTCQSGECKAPPPPACNDGDGDGYGNPGQDNCRSGASTDCNDADSSKWQLLTGYLDGDGDGYGSGSGTSICSGNSLPAGYSLTSNDCNDNPTTGSAVHILNSCGVCAAAPANAPGGPCSGTSPSGCTSQPGTYTCNSAGGTYCNVNDPIALGFGCTVYSSGCTQPGTYTCTSGTLTCTATAGSTQTCDIPCSNGIKNSGEVCDPGYDPSYSGPRTDTNVLSCSGGYPSVTQTCKDDCTGYTGGCGFCGDTKVNGPEQCELGQTRQYTCPSGNTLPQTCTNSCTWTDVSACVLCNNAPTVSLSPASWSTIAGTAASKTFTVGVRNNDPAACAASTYDLSRICPADLSCGALPASLPVAPQGTGTASFAVNVGASVLAGSSYSVSASATNRASGKSGSRTATVSVNTKPVTCGNGVLNSSEQCDGSLFSTFGGSSACSSMMGAGASGTLTCNSDCTINTDGCTITSTSASCEYGLVPAGELNEVRALDDALDGACSATFQSPGLPQEVPLSASYTISGDKVYYAWVDGISSLTDTFVDPNTGTTKRYGGALNLVEANLQGAVAGHKQTRKYECAVSGGIQCGGTPKLKVSGGMLYIAWMTAESTWDGGTANGMFTARLDTSKNVNSLGLYPSRGVLPNQNAPASYAGIIGFNAYGDAFLSSQDGILSPRKIWINPFGSSTYQQMTAGTAELNAQISRFMQVTDSVRIGDYTYHAVLEADEFGVNYATIAKVSSAGSLVKSYNVGASSAQPGSGLGGIRDIRLKSLGKKIYSYYTYLAQPNINLEPSAQPYFVSVLDMETGSIKSMFNPLGVKGDVNGLLCAAKASSSVVDGQFKDSRGERTAAEVDRLPPYPAGICGALGYFFVRTRNCAQGVCTSDANDKAWCDKPSDCIFNKKCYSDITTVAATYFGGDTSLVLKSPVWKGEVSADVNGDGKKELCDPGQWVGDGGTANGTVTDKTTGAPIGDAVVWANSTNKLYNYDTTTNAAGFFSFSSMEATNYDFTASKARYVTGFQNNIPVQPSKNVVVDFQLDRATSNVTGYVTNISQSPEPNAVASALVRVVGTAFMAVTDASGKYSITEVPQGTYDFVASKVSDGYQDATKLSVPLSESKASVNFTLLRSLGNCNNDCTVGSSNVCDASCNGKGLCLFDSDATKQACDGTFGLVKMPDGKYVECCKGKPYMPTKANMIVPSDNVIVTRVPVLFKGKFLNLVIAVFNKK